MQQLRIIIYVYFLSSVYVGSGRGATLLPYGPSNPADSVLLLDDDETVELPTLTEAFQFYGTSYTSIWASDNGYLAFDELDECCDADFPKDYQMIAPLWDDWELGQFYYRQTTTDFTDLASSCDIAFPGIPVIGGHFSREKSLPIVQHLSSFMDAGGYVVGDTEFTDFATFQAILTTDGTSSFAIFLYDKIDNREHGTVGINAGDDVHYSKLCITDTDAILNLPEMKVGCGSSEPGMFGFRMDVANPDQDSYVCEESYTEDNCASNYCAWTDVSHTLIGVVTTINYPGADGIMAWDTQKYEDGENPNLADSACKTLYTSDPTSLAFTIDPNAATPACGVRVTGTTVKTLEITIRVYHDDERFDIWKDKIYQFTCTTDTVLPRSVTQNKMFGDIEVTELPDISRNIELQVTSPNTGDVLSQVRTGQLFKLRIIYDNTANNIAPYGVYVIDCLVADTVNFDTSVVNLIQNGCVSEQDPDKVWYVSRSFQQTSLSATGLFISDSGTMTAARFVNKNKLFFRCTVNFCFLTVTGPNLCTNSCPVSGRKRRRTNDSRIATYPEVVSTSIDVVDTLEADPKMPKKKCINKVKLYSVLAMLGMLVVASFLAAFVLFCKILTVQRLKSSTNRKITVFVSNNK